MYPLGMAPLHSALLPISLVAIVAGCPREVEDGPLDEPRAQPSEPAEFGAEDRAAIEQLLEQQRLAWNRGDLDGFLAAYEPSEQLLFTSGATGPAWSRSSRSSCSTATRISRTRG